MKCIQSIQYSQKEHALYSNNRELEVELGTASRNLAAKPQQAHINTDIIQIQIQLQTQIQYI